MWQLREHLGSMPRSKATTEISSITRSDREALRRIGVRIQRQSIFVPRLLKPAAMLLRGMLFDLQHGRSGTPVPSEGRVSVPKEKNIPNDFYEAVGYRKLEKIAVRVDIIERVASRAWELSKSGPFPTPIDLMNLIGCGPEEIKEVFKHLGYRYQKSKGRILFQRQKTIPIYASRKSKKEGLEVNPDSPFSKLASLRDFN